MNKEIIQTLSTVLLGLNNISVMDRQNVKNMNTCMDLLEDLIKKLSQASSSEEE